MSPWLGHTLDEAPLGEHEQKENRDDNQSACRHELVPGRVAGAALEELEAEGERELVLVGQVDQRADEVIPHRQAVEQGDDREGRLAQRQDDPPEAAPARAAVEHGGLFQLLGNAEEELPQQEDVERAAEPRRHPQRLERADPAEVFEEHVRRHHDDGEGDHHGGQAEREHRVAAAEANAGEAVGGDRAGEQHAGQAEDQDDQRVAGVEQEVEVRRVQHLLVRGSRSGAWGRTAVAGPRSASSATRRASRAAAGRRSTADRDEQRVEEHRAGQLLFHDLTSRGSTRPCGSRETPLRSAPG